MTGLFKELYDLKYSLEDLNLAISKLKIVNELIAKKGKYSKEESNPILKHILFNKD